MSGPEDRRGTDGGEHPLDVDARFADIIAHFHDDEPSRPRVVDGFDESGPAGTPTTDPAAPGATGSNGGGPTEGQDAPGPAAADPAAAPAEPTAPVAGPPPGRARPQDPSRPGERARGEEAVRDLGAADDLAAMRRSYEARISAEVERAVHGADGGHFVPEEPPPIPRPDLPGRLAWSAVLAGPVLLLLCALLWRDAPTWLLGAVVTATVGGFGYLVWRLPRTGDRDDRDDGAIV